MARDFTSATNAITYSNLSNGSLARSYGGWFYIDTIDGTDRRLWEWGTALNNQNGNPRVNSTRLAISIGEIITSSFGDWQTTSLPTTGQWIHIFFTFAGTDADDPKIYYDGVSQTVTENTAPAGTMASGAVNCVFGNRAAGDRPFDGRMAEWAHWGRVLSQEEISGLAKGFSPRKYTNSLKRHMRFLGNSDVEADVIQGATGVITGTVNKIDHPRIINPR